MDARTDTVREFYDDLAPRYDAMTGFANRFERERPAFSALIKRFGIRTALDAGCGTGFHSLLLAELGVAVTGVDASAEMIRLAGENARRLGRRIRFAVSELKEMSGVADTQYDGIVVLGNTLAHILSDSERLSVLRQFSQLLAPEGILVIQILNYERIMNSRERIQQETRSNGWLIVRSYEYDPSGILFTIRSQSETDLQKAVREHTVRLHPLTGKELTFQLASVGFQNVTTHGSLSLLPFIPADSRDLVVLARFV